MRCGSNFADKCGGTEGGTEDYHRFAGEGGGWGAPVYLPGIQNLMKLKFYSVIILVILLQNPLKMVILSPFRRNCCTAYQ